MKQGPTRNDHFWMGIKNPRHLAKIGLAQFHVIIQEGHKVRTGIHGIQARVPLRSQSDRRRHERDTLKGEGLRQNVIQTWTYEENLFRLQQLPLHRADGVVEDGWTPNRTDDDGNLHVPSYIYATYIQHI
jgi:hypothetical protein